MSLRILFQQGTLLLYPSEEQASASLPECIASYCRYDDRVQCWRAAAPDYAAIVTTLYRQKIPYTDGARRFSALPCQWMPDRSPRDYQQEALTAWLQANKRGVVVLPTGTGKSFLAQMAIARCNRNTLVIAPTLDLVSQWEQQLSQAFRTKVGILGGGSHTIEPITVSTYDSAQLMMDQIGDAFGVLICDECHHLPGAVYSQLARLSIAPYRLGLTATPERPDGLDCQYAELLGPICYRREITDMPASTVLAPYDTIVINTPLDAEEEQQYLSCHAKYIAFVHRHHLNFSERDGWSKFIQLCCRQPDGREAFQAYLAQKRIARSPRSKMLKLWELLCRHRQERVIVFTADNATAYQIGELFCLPVITHHTKSAERSDFLTAFREGRYPVLVTSKVLNEGVDVPSASIAVILSGSGSIREHVQRLGRILRPAPGKRAVLYELISGGTSEENISERRRQHSAFGGGEESLC